MARKGAALKDLIELLKKVPLFASCSKKELEAIARSGKVVEHGAGHVICREGDTGYGLHVIVEGETSVEKSDGAKRGFGPGAFFGEIAVLDRGPRTATVVAETEVVTFVLPSWHFRTLVKSQPSITLKVLEEVCQRVRANESSLTH